MLTDWRDEVLAGIYSMEVDQSATVETSVGLDKMLTYYAITTSDKIRNLSNASAGQFKLLYTAIGLDFEKKLTINGTFLGGSFLEFRDTGDGVILRSTGSAWEVLAILGKPMHNIQPTPPALSYSDYQGLFLNSLHRMEQWAYPTDMNYEMDNVSSIMFLDSSSYGGTLTFENDGVPGQHKMVSLKVGGNEVSVTSDLFKGFSSIVLKDLSDGCILYHNGEQWQVLRLLNDAKRK